MRLRYRFLIAAALLAALVALFSACRPTEPTPDAATGTEPPTETEASPETEILLRSILPIAPSYAHWEEITNASITAANAWIPEVAERRGLHCLDTFSALVGEDGNIRPELVKDDGLHANEEGLKLALGYIRTHAFTGRSE